VREIDLHQWAERYRAANLLLPGATLVLMASLLIASPQGTGGSGEAVRYVGLVMATAHGVSHTIALYLFKLLCRGRVKGADAAKRTYTDPRCFSHIDLCAAWLMFYLVAPWLT
jgi:hypothetical protein